MSTNAVLARGTRPAVTATKPSHVKAFFEVGPDPADSGALTTQERDELTRCEEIIRKGWESFVEVGVALTTIRDQRLYRDSHKTFEAYCREKWDYKRSHAYRLIAAVEVVKCLSPIGDIPQPTHESQVRPLIGLDPDKVVAVWKKAAAKAEGPVIKAAVVKEAAREYLPEKATRPAKRAKRPGDVGTSRVLKCLADLEQAIRAGKGKETLLKLLSRAKAEVTKA